MTHYTPNSQKKTRLWKMIFPSLHMQFGVVYKVPQHVIVNHYFPWSWWTYIISHMFINIHIVFPHTMLWILVEIPVLRAQQFLHLCQASNSPRKPPWRAPPETCGGAPRTACGRGRAARGRADPPGLIRRNPHGRGLRSSFGISSVSYINRWIWEQTMAGYFVEQWPKDKRMGQN